jgi:MerR family copper efflux transcriptional regulator
VESQVAPRQLTECPAQELEKIGAVATRSGVSVKTIRFYCDQGLLQPSARSEGRYRLFDASVYGELALIRTLRALDIPLPTITAVLEARRSGVCTCDNLQATIRAKAGEIEQRIADLQSLHNELNGLLMTWQRCGGRPVQASAGS